MSEEDDLRSAIAAGESDKWFDLGYLLHEQDGREDEAEHAYRMAIQAGVRTDTAWFNLGALFFAARPDEAEAAFRTAIALGDSDGWLRLAELLYGLEGRVSDVEAASR